MSSVADLTGTFLIRSMLGIGACAIAQGQTTWFVDDSATAPGAGTLSEPFSRIDFAVQQPAVVDGDTVVVLPGSYADEAIVLGGKGLTIVSQSGATNTFITGSIAQTPSEALSAGSLVTIVGVGLSPTSIVGFTFSDFESPQSPPGTDASAVELIDSDAVFLDCVFTQSSGGNGSSLIDVVGGTPQFQACEWDSNLFGCGGGVRAQFADLLFLDCTWRDTTLPLLVSGGSLSVQGCTFEGNMDAACGTFTAGTLVAEQAAVSIENTSFLGISTVNGGFTGPQHMELRDCQTTIEASSLTGGRQESAPGAGIHAVNGTLEVRGTDFTQLSADRGGAVGLIGTSAIFRKCSFVDNDGGLEEFEGGAIEAQMGGDLTVMNSTFESNRAGAGGAIATTGTPLVLKSSTFLNNRANRGTFFDGFLVRGGAVYTDSSALISNCDFEGNVAESGYTQPIMDRALGGALFLDAASTVEHCLFFDNSTEAGGNSQGGAIFGIQDCVVSRSIFDTNRATVSFSASGGALGGEGSAEFCTFYNNTAVQAASVAESWLVRNSILVPTSAPPLGPGAIVEYCLVVGGLPGLGNIDGDPAFFGDGDFHLRLGSDAVDAGDPLSPPDADGSRVDMGALPFQFGYCRFECIPVLLGPGCPLAPNSTGQVGRTIALGSQVLGEDSFYLAADQLPVGVVGSFLLSPRASFSPQFGGGVGNLCLGAPILRVGPGPGPANNAGQVGQAVHLAELPGGGPGVGETWGFQFWHRDLDGRNVTSNTTARLDVTFR